MVAKPKVVKRDQHYSMYLGETLQQPIKLGIDLINRHDKAKSRYTPNTTAIEFHEGFTSTGYQSAKINSAL